MIANLNSSRLWHLVDATTVDTHDLPYAWGDYPMLEVTTQKVEKPRFFLRKDLPLSALGMAAATQRSKIQLLMSSSNFCFLIGHRGLC